MSNTPAAFKKIHLHWMRDSAQGGLSYPFTTTVAVGAGLGSAVETLLGQKLKSDTVHYFEEIEARLPSSDCELHLPFVERKELANIDEVCRETSLVEDAAGIFRLTRKDQKFEEEFFRQCLTLMAPAIFPVTTSVPVSVTFGDSREAARGAFLPWIPRVYEGQDGRVCERVAVSLTITQQGQGAWGNTCPERNRRFLPLYARVSVAMRKAMRFWVPFEFFTQRNSYADATLVWPLLAWAAASSPQAKNIREFSYDILDVDSMARAERSFRRNLRGYLETIAPALSAMDMPALSRRYSPGRASEGADQAIYNRNNLHSLFSGEADLFDIVQRICLELAGLRTNEELTMARRLRRFHKIVRAFSRDFVFRLRHFYASKNWECLATVLLLEITNALDDTPQPLAVLLDGKSMKSVVRVEPLAA